MARHEVFKDVGESLAGLVRLEAKAQKLDVDVVVGPPDAAFFAGKKGAIAVYLYDFHYDRNVNQEGEETQVDVTDDSGTYTILYGRPLILEVRFLVAATGKTPADEQVNLGLAVKAFFERPALAAGTKAGRSLPGHEMPVDLDEGFTAERKWTMLQSLGVTHHVLVGYRVHAEMKPERELRRTRKVERRSIELFDRHRPPEGKGEDAERPRPKPAKAK